MENNRNFIITDRIDALQLGSIIMYKLITSRDDYVILKTTAHNIPSTKVIVCCLYLFGMEGCKGYPKKEDDEGREVYLYKMKFSDDLIKHQKKKKVYNIDVKEVIEWIKMDKDQKKKLYVINKILKIMKQKESELIENVTREVNSD